MNTTRDIKSRTDVQFHKLEIQKINTLDAVSFHSGFTCSYLLDISDFDFEVDEAFGCLTFWSLETFDVTTLLIGVFPCVLLMEKCSAP